MRSLFSTILAIGMLVAAAPAATITWNAPANCVADTDVITTGQSIYAYTFSNVARTVNGTTFAASGLAAGTTTTPIGGGNITTSGFANANTTAFTDANNPFNSLSYKAMLVGAIFNSSTAAATVNLNNLTVGVTYQVQVWCGDPRAGTATRTTAITSGANSATVDYNVGNVAGAVGQYIVGTFTANATSQSFTVSGGASNQINALQLRTAAARWSGSVNGNWDNTTLNFSGLNFTTAKAGGLVEFGDTSSSGAAVTQSTVTIQAGGVTGANILFSNASVNYTLNGADANGMTGAFGLTKNAAGQLTLQGANTFSGETAMSAGTLRISHAAALQNSTLNFTAGTLAFNTITTATLGAMKGSRPLSLQNSATAAVALTVGGNNESTSYTGSLSGAGSLNKIGNGSLALTAASTHSGGTTVSGGTLVLNSTHASAMTVAGGRLDYANGTTAVATFPAFAQSSGTVRMDVTAAGADLIQVNGNLSFTGGAIELNFISSPTPASPYTLFNYTGALTGVPTIINPTRVPYTLDSGTGSNSAVTITFGASATELIWRGAVDSEWTTAAKNNWLNGVVPDQFLMLDNVLFDDTAEAGRFGVTIPAPITPSVATVDNSANPYVLSGAAISGGAQLKKRGSGILTLASANAHTGGTMIEAGEMTINHANSLGTGAVTVDGSLNVIVPGAASVAISGLSNALSGGGEVNVTLGMGSNSVLLNGNYSQFAGTINVGVNAVVGSGKIQLNGVLPATAEVNAMPHATVFVAAGVTQPAALTLAGGDLGEALGQLRLESNANWSGPVTLTGYITSTNDAHIGGNTSALGTISGPISESGGAKTLVKAGAGTITLTGNNTYTGGTIVRLGRLHAGSNQALGASTGGVEIRNTAAVQLQNNVTITGKVATITGAANDFNGALQCAGNATWAGGIKIEDASANNPRVGAVAGGILTISGGIIDGVGTNLFISAGAVTAGVGGAASVVLSAPQGASTYTGMTGVIRGTLEMGAAYTLPASTILDIDSASGVQDTVAVDLKGYSQEVSGLQDTATTNLGSVLTNSAVTPAQLIMNVKTGAYTYDGIISGKVGLHKKGAGTQVIGGTYSHTGDTTVQAGTLTLMTGTLHDSSDVFLSTGGVLNLMHAVTDTVERLEINGVGQASGVWGAVGSGAANQTTLITGTGKLFVTTGVDPTGFTLWIQNFLELTNAPDRAMGADPDGDGLTNFAEFSFGGNPTSSNSRLSYFSSAADTNQDSISESIFTVAVRDGAVFSNQPQSSAEVDGIIYTIEGSLNLTNFGQGTSPAVIPLGVWELGGMDPQPPGGYQWYRFRLAGSDGLPARGFFRAKSQSVTP